MFYIGMVEKITRLQSYKTKIKKKGAKSHNHLQTMLTYTNGLAPHQLYLQRSHHWATDQHIQTAEN